MAKPPALQLSSPDVESFIGDAPTPKPSSRTTDPPAAPKRGHVLQASGRVVRRLVVNIDPELGAELDRRREQTGAPLSRIAGDALRAGLGL